MASFGLSICARKADQQADGLTKPFGPKAMKRFQTFMLGTQLQGIMAQKVRHVASEIQQSEIKKQGKAVTFAEGTKRN
jgi:hypothetical protein